MINFRSDKRKVKSYMTRFFDKALGIDAITSYSKNINNSFKDGVFIVTGANSPIGKFVLDYLLSNGAIAVAIVKTVRFVGETQCDLSDPRQVLDFCERFKSKFTKLNGIINLASGMYETYETNSFGIEKTFATNVIAPYLLFKNLLPLIESTGGARILNVINPLMLSVKMKPEDLNSNAIYYARNTFLQCERYRVELWHHLAEEYSNIRLHCVIPGFARTYGLKKKFPLFYSKHQYNIFSSRRFRRINTAAMIILWCLVTPKISSIPNGELIFDKAVQKEYIIKEHETLKEDHEKFISNFYKLLEQMLKKNN